MAKLVRHCGVFILSLVAATAISFFAPLTWDPRNVFLCTTLLFFFYLAVSTILGK
ncbi:hypothetical protein ACC668_02710 [Rhizobium ruizarguesonis]